MSNTKEFFSYDTCRSCFERKLCVDSICGSCMIKLIGVDTFEGFLLLLIEQFSPQMDERCGSCGGNLDHNYRCRNLECNQHYIR